MSKITKIGLPSGGTTGQVLKKKTGTNYDVEWGTGGGGGSGTVTSVATAAPITGGTITTTGTIGITQATTSTDGYLSSTDWNTFNNKQSSLTNPVTGTGTTNYLPKFTGASTIGNSLVYDNGTSVGIGTASPSYKFQVSGTSGTVGISASSNTADDILFYGVGTVTGNINLLTTNINATSTSLLVNRNYNSATGNAQIEANVPSTSTGDPYFLLTTSGATNWSLGIDNSASDIFKIGPNANPSSGSASLSITTGGNTLIGTTTDSGFKLDVNGLVNFTGTTASDGGQLGAELLSASGWTSTGWTGSFGAGWTHTVGNTTALTNTLAAVNGNYYQITYTVTGRTAGSFTLAFGGYSGAGITATGNVGPRATSTGTLSITPTTDFDGTIVISIKQISSGSASVTLKNSAGTITNQVRAFTSNSNLGIGVNSGFLLTTGLSNTFVGYSTGNANTSSSGNSFFGSNAGASNTIGNSNSFYGNFSGTNTTTGSNNSFYGAASGQNNTTASSNCFFGTNSGLSNTTGTGNSYFGLNSGLNNILGSSNTFIGGSSGRFISSGGSLTSVNNSTFLGVDTRANADSETNQLVVGYAAIGLGSNTTVIGNSSTTYGRWWGNLLVGTSTNGGYALDVSGTTRFAGNFTQSSGTATFGNGILLDSTSRIFSNGTVNYQGNSTTVQNVFSNQIASSLNGTIVRITNGSGTWGSTTNSNFFNITGRAVASTGSIDITSILIDNQVGTDATYSGAIRGIYYNPSSVLGSGFTHYAIQTVIGNIYFASTSGSVGIGVAPSATYKLDVNGTARIQDNLTISDAKNIILDTTTGTKIGTATTQKIGFFNATPVVQPSAYTQTYSTATKTHSNLTSADLTGITSSTTGSALAEPSAAYTQAEMQQNFRAIQDQYNALKADLTNLKQVVNQIIDDHQSLGLLG